MKITMYNALGQIREVKRGFSWTTLLFGFFVPLFRGDWKWTLIMIVTAIFTGGISWLIFPFLYNKLYEDDLIKNGYKDENLIENGFGFNNDFK